MAGLLFQEKGYQATTIADIADRLGTDRASIYYYVGSKRELLQKAVREATMQNVTAIEKIVASDASASDKLRLAIVTQMESYRSSYPYLHIFLQEKFPSLSKDESAWSKEISQWSDRYFRAMYRIIESGGASGEFKVAVPLTVATMAMIGAVNWAHRWYKPEGELSANAIGQGFATILLDGFRASASENGAG